jgi:hypothetical protein
MFLLSDNTFVKKNYLLAQVAAASGIFSWVGSTHPNPLLAPILNLVSRALENFQGELKFLSGGLTALLAAPLRTSSKKDHFLGVDESHIGKIRVTQIQNRFRLK